MNRELPVRTWRTPAELSEILKVSIDDSGVDTDELISTIDTYLSECVRTQNQNFLQQLWGGLSEAR